MAGEDLTRGPRPSATALVELALLASPSPEEDEVDRALLEDRPGCQIAAGDRVLLDMDTLTIQLSEHAVERFQQRVRPGLGLAEAEDELARLALFADVVEQPPAWHLRSCVQVAPAYLLLGDVLLPLQRHWAEPDVLVATTCLARGEWSEDLRRRRRDQRHRARRRLRALGTAGSPC